MGKRVDPRRVKIHWTLTVDEWAGKLDVHKNTILRWIREDGLEAITDQKPYLIRGVALKPFLQQIYKSKRQPCGTGEMNCFACRQPRKPAGNLLDYKPNNPSSGRLTGLCETCLTPMNQFIRQDEITSKFPNCSVTATRRERTLSDTPCHLVDVHFEKPDGEPESSTEKQAGFSSDSNINQDKGPQNV